MTQVATLDEAIDGKPIIPTEVIGGKPVAIAYMEDDGSLLAVEYPEGEISVELMAAILGNMIKDTLGETPDMQKVIALQRTLVAVMSGGESEGKRGK